MRANRSLAGALAAVLFTGGCASAGGAPEDSTDQGQDGVSATTDASPQPHHSDASIAGQPLELTIQPGALPGDEWTDVSLTVRFLNKGKAPQTVYPRAAQWHVVGGWGSPSWTLETKNLGPGNQPFVEELRTYYGPPGHPPGASYFVGYEVAVAPGKTHDHNIKACWIPHSTLEKRNLSAKNLDPEGMDGLDPTKLDGASVLALDRECRELKREARKRDDFIRPGVNIFVPPSTKLDVRIGYSQAPSMGFQPAEEIIVTSAWVSLAVE